ncbi:MAG TPA: hypothetical protein VE988_21155 [Gemmataceae bacterium]|nr:hypothetical protein [Gemmataceae bacterium]
MSTATASPPASVPAIASDQALQIARLDAERAYDDMARFRIQIALEKDGWHIDYYLKNPNVNGGGPQYLINAMTGDIISKKYYQ